MESKSQKQRKDYKQVIIKKKIINQFHDGEINSMMAAHPCSLMSSNNIRKDYLPLNIEADKLCLKPLDLL